MPVSLVLQPVNVEQNRILVEFKNETVLSSTVALTHIANALKIDANDGASVHVWLTFDGANYAKIDKSLTASECFDNGWMLRYSLEKGTYRYCCYCVNLMEHPCHRLSKKQLKQLKTHSSNQVERITRFHSYVLNFSYSSD